MESENHRQTPALPAVTLEGSPQNSEKIVR